jgi:hypothetical protein
MAGMWRPAVNKTLSRRDISRRVVDIERSLLS